MADISKIKARIVFATADFEDAIETVTHWILTRRPEDKEMMAEYVKLMDAANKWIGVVQETIDELRARLAEKGVET